MKRIIAAVVFAIAGLIFVGFSSLPVAACPYPAWDQPADPNDPRNYTSACPYFTTTVPTTVAPTTVPPTTVVDSTTTTSSTTSTSSTTTTTAPPGIVTSTIVKVGVDNTTLSAFALGLILIGCGTLCTGAVVLARRK